MTSAHGADVSGVPGPQVIAKAIHGNVLVTLGGTPRDESDQWRRSPATVDDDRKLATGTIARSA